MFCFNFSVFRRGSISENALACQEVMNFCVVGEAHMCGIYCNLVISKVDVRLMLSGSISRQFMMTSTARAAMNL